MVSDTESDQRADGEPESDSKQVVNGTGAHGGGSGLDVAKVIGIHADGAKERREGANVHTPVVRRVCARVDGARLALGAIEHVMREDARVDHERLLKTGR